MSTRRRSTRRPLNYTEPDQFYPRQTPHSTLHLRMEPSDIHHQSAAEDIRLTRLVSEPTIQSSKSQTTSNSNTSSRGKKSRTRVPKDSKSANRVHRIPTPLPFSPANAHLLPPSRNLRHPYPTDYDYDYDEHLALHPSEGFPQEMSIDSSVEEPYGYIDDPSSLRENPRENTFSVAQAAKSAKNRLTKTLSFHASTTTEKKKTFDQNRVSIEPNRRRRSTLTPRADTFAFSTFSTADDSKKVEKGNNYRSDTVDVQVRAWVLEGNGSGLRKGGKIAEWAKKRGPHRTVRVEANPSNLAQTVLYASDQMISSPIIEPYKETEFVTASPEYVDRDAIVYQDSKFEIFVVGMNISADDFRLGHPDYNEALLFSLHTDPGEPGEDNDALPYIHYDPSRIDKHKSTEPDQFIPIPASRSLFMASDGAERGFETRKSVNCRFKILELEKIDELMKMSLAGIEKLGSHISQFSSGAPSLGVLSPALTLAGTISKRAIESHAKSDKVITTDINFLLAERQKPEINPSDGVSVIPFERRSGEFLRYGYYFFLEKRVDAKLYASFRTFPNVSLMMRRMDKLGPNEPEFFPLTGVSYIVIRVTPRTTTMKATRRPIRMSHVQRLEDLMRTCITSNSSEKHARHVVDTLGQLARDLGISAEDNNMNHDKETTESSPGRDSASS